MRRRLSRMRNTMKVARWEIKRNLKNKSFIIGLFITPILFALFAIIPSLFASSEEPVDVFIKDELNIYSSIKANVEQSDYLEWELNETDLDEVSIFDQLEARKNIAYIPLTEESLDSGTITVYTSENIEDSFPNQLDVIKDPLKQLQYNRKSTR